MKIYKKYFVAFQSKYPLNLFVARYWMKIIDYHDTHKELNSSTYNGKRG